MCTLGINHHWKIHLIYSTKSQFQKNPLPLASKSKALILHLSCRSHSSWRTKTHGLVERMVGWDMCLRFSHIITVLVQASTLFWGPELPANFKRSEGLKTNHLQFQSTRSSKFGHKFYPTDFVRIVKLLDVSAMVSFHKLVALTLIFARNLMEPLNGWYMVPTRKTYLIFTYTRRKGLGLLVPFIVSTCDRISCISWSITYSNINIDNIYRERERQTSW